MSGVQIPAGVETSPFESQAQLGRLTAKYRSSGLFRNIGYLLRRGGERLKAAQSSSPSPSSGCYFARCHSFNFSLRLPSPLHKDGTPTLSSPLRYRSL